MDRPEMGSDDLEDIRFAVVMSGGVSLAVWMGGVTTEINRLVQSEPHSGGNTYEGLLGIVRATARVDVISGTSAGGINGAFLALAAVYGLDLSGLGDLWARDGSFSSLLRGPLEKDPPSLLRGDEYFLVKLREAFEDLFPDDWEGRCRPPHKVPINLTITSTLLKGEPTRFIDDFGTGLTESDHRARFKFVRSQYTGPAEDPFCGPNIVPRLALASRSTASFPAAFEPSFVPVNARGPDNDHPDMVGAATFRQNRFVIDGGVLMNQPIGPALDAIMAQPADRQVRRILAYINPDPLGNVTPGPADHPENMPTVAAVLLNSLVTLPGSQSVKEELEQIVDHNRRVRDRRLSRIDLASAVGGSLEEFARNLFGSYQDIRRRRAISRIATIVAGLIGEQPLSTEASGAEPPPAWTREELVAAFEPDSFTLVPQTLPGPGELVSTLDWGLSPVERLGAMAIDVFKRAMWLAPFSDEDLRMELQTQRLKLHEHLHSLRAVRIDDMRFWRNEVLGYGRTDEALLPRPPLSSSERPGLLRNWASQSLARWPVGSHEPRERREEILRGLELVTVGIVQLLVEASPSLRRTAESAGTSAKRGWREEAGRLGNLLDVIFGSGAGAMELSVDDVLRRLMYLEVCQFTLTCEEQGADQDVSLIQFSGNCDTSFIDRPLTASDKLSGVNLAHFAAFYKESWRVSDWTWGRLDGATKLCQAVLGPERLNQFGGSSAEVYDLIFKVAVEDAPEADRAELRRRFPEAACRAELEFISDETVPVPPSLPSCAMAIARRLHLEILRTELLRLERACRLDIERGAKTQGRGAEFLTSFETLRQQYPGEQLPANAIFDLFKDARIGKETLSDDISSDLMASTVTTTAAVAVSVIQSQGSGLGPICILGRALRGYTVILYMLMRSALAGGFGATAVSFLLALGGAFVGLSLLGDTPPLIGTLGATVLLAGISMAALRTRAPVLALILGLFAIGILCFAIWDAAGSLSAILDRGRELIIIGALVVLGLSLGSVNSRKRPTVPREPCPCHYQHRD